MKTNEAPAPKMTVAEFLGFADKLGECCFKQNKDFDPSCMVEVEAHALSVPDEDPGYTLIRLGNGYGVFGESQDYTGHG